MYWNIVYKYTTVNRISSFQLLHAEHNMKKNPIRFILAVSVEHPDLQQYVVPQPICALCAPMIYLKFCTTEDDSESAIFSIKLDRNIEIYLYIVPYCRKDWKRWNRPIDEFWHMSRAPGFHKYVLLELAQNYTNFLNFSVKVKYVSPCFFLHCILL